MIQINRVVTKNFIEDIIAKFQNLFGMNLTGYEKMIDKGHQQIQDEIKEKGLKIKWFRMEIAQLTSGAIVMMFYGEEE